MSAIICGAGIAGLAAANLLAARRFDVVVVEARRHAGRVRWRRGCGG
jgi:2-polyprenyl-6-methoxyphenol hydroxylase-like FAD-dependent oxidoreductase